MLKHTSLPSIEEFAAFLDGNLSANDMQQFTQLAAHDGVLHQLLQANSVVDDTLDGITNADLQLPVDLVNTDFELPEKPSSEDVSMFSDISQDDHTTMGEDMQNDSSLTMPDNGDFANSDDWSGSFSDDL